MDMTAGPAIDAALRAALDTQRAAYLADPEPSLAQRRADLRTLQRFVRDHKQAICDAISADYGHRSRHETLPADVPGTDSGFPDSNLPLHRLLLDDPDHVLEQCDAVLAEGGGLVEVVGARALRCGLRAVAKPECGAIGVVTMYEADDEQRPRPAKFAAICTGPGRWATLGVRGLFVGHAIPEAVWAL